MQELMLNTNTLPDTLHSRIRADRVSVREENGTIILTPVTKSQTTNLWGLLPDDKFTSEKYLAQKRQDKELEP
jgi:virulence-associated protein VagC